MKYTEHLQAFALLPRILESIQRLPLDELEAIADDMNAESNGAAAMLDAHTARIKDFYAAIERERKERTHAIQ